MHVHMHVHEHKYMHMHMHNVHASCTWSDKPSPCFALKVRDGPGGEEVLVLRWEGNDFEIKTAPGA
mgnify:CR=1 FL=1